jgi:Gas vesicle synthesis protein GvpL/GvpF
MDSMYTYAFLPAIPIELPEGIAGSLQVICTEGLAALVEPDLAVESLQANDKQLVQAVMTHDRVIRELFEQTTVLPLRFGTCFVSRQGLLEHLASNSEEYLGKLNGLQGKAEYPLRLTPIPFPDSSIAPETKGKDYFLAKKQIFQDQSDWVAQQQQQLAALWDSIAQRYPSWVKGEADQGVERVYLLSDRSDELLLHQFLKGWQSRYTHWKLSLGESLPPYHFV